MVHGSWFMANFGSGFRVDSAGLVPIAKAKDMVKGSILTLSEIETDGKEYLRTDGYENMDVTECDTLLKKKAI